LPGGSSKKTRKKADKKAGKSALKGKRKEEDVASFKAGESDEDDD